MCFPLKVGKIVLIKTNLVSSLRQVMNNKEINKKNHVTTKYGPSKEIPLVVCEYVCKPKSKGSLGLDKRRC